MASCQSGLAYLATGGRLQLPLGSCTIKSAGRCLCGIRMEHILEHLCYEEVMRVIRSYCWSFGV